MHVLKGINYGTVLQTQKLLIPTGCLNSTDGDKQMQS